MEKYIRRQEITTRNQTKQNKKNTTTKNAFTTKLTNIRNYFYPTKLKRLSTKNFHFKL